MRTPFLLLCLALAFFVIALHQLATVGVLQSYIFFMLSLALILGARLIAARDKKKQADAAPQAKGKIIAAKKSVAKKGKS